MSRRPTSRALSGALATATVLATVTAAGTLSAGIAGAAPAADNPFGGWSSCPIDNPETSTCMDVTVTGGNMKIGKLSVGIPAGAMRIAGGVAYRENPEAEFGFDQVFIPPNDNSRGIYAEPIEIPGGALGIDLPFDNLFGLNKASATVESTSALPTVDAFQLGVKLPVKLKIANPLLGGKCYLGSDNNPVQLNLDVTEYGVLEEVPGFPDTAVVRNTGHTGQPFAVPTASGCGPFGVLNPIVNWRAGLPSSTTSNSLATTSDVYNIGADSLRPQPAGSPEPAAVAAERSAK